jgi:hypothetical protein
LLVQDRFDEARLAYKRAGRPELSSQMLQQLCHNAVVENRFKDASFYFWTLAQEVLDSLPRKGAGNGLDVAAEFGLAELSQVRIHASTHTEPLLAAAGRVLDLHRIRSPNLLCRVLLSALEPRAVVLCPPQPRAY